MTSVSSCTHDTRRWSGYMRPRSKQWHTAGAHAANAHVVIGAGQEPFPRYSWAVREVQI
jgi:hypothetical protein